MATRRSLDDWNMGLSSSPDAEFGQPSVMSIYGSTIGGLIRYYAAEGKGEVLRTVLAHAIQAGAVSGLAEYRYTDADYRDEHQHFYSTTHRRYPSSAHRLHFFRNESSVVKANHPLRLKNLDYVGYSVLRPVRAAPVGRTMLPALDSNSSILCSAADRVNLYGTTLEARAMPFISQDAQLTRCAHVALWNAAYYHHLTFGGQRIYPGRIATASSPYSPAGRVLPSPGLTVGQVSTISSAIGLPPIVYPLESLARGQEVERIICRYLNSRIPVIITTLHHAFTLIGYERTVNNHGEPSIRFWRHDDEKGLYQAVDDWRRDKPGGGVWRYATVPLPTKIYLPAE